MPLSYHNIWISHGHHSVYAMAILNWKTVLLWVWDQLQALILINILCQEMKYYQKKEKLLKSQCLILVEKYLLLHDLIACVTLTQSHVLNVGEFQMVELLKLQNK